MEEVIILVIIGFLLTFGTQLMKGVGNIFSISGRVFGWILGIVLMIFIVKTTLFSVKNGEGSLNHFAKELGIEDYKVEKKGDTYYWYIDEHIIEYKYVDGKYEVQ